MIFPRRKKKPSADGSSPEPSSIPTGRIKNSTPKSQSPSTSPTPTTFTNGTTASSYASAINRNSEKPPKLSPSRKTIPTKPANGAYDSISEKLPHLIARHWPNPIADPDSPRTPRQDKYDSWLLQALTEETPFDQILTSQLAGDLLPDRTFQDFIATYYLRQIGSKNRQSATAASLLGQPGFDHSANFTCPTESLQNPDGSPLLELPTSEQNLALTNLATQEKKLLKTLAEIPTRRQLDFQNWLRQPDRIPDIPGLVALYPLDATGKIYSSSIAPAEQAFLELYPGENTPPLITPDPLPTTPGVHGLAPRFDGTSVITLQETFILKRHLPFTLSFWIKIPGPAEKQQTILASTAHPGSYKNGLFLTLEGTTLKASLTALNSISIQSPPHTLHPNRWTHLALTYDGSSTAQGLSLFIDGSPIETLPSGEPLRTLLSRPQEIQSLYLGGAPKRPGIVGTAIDELHIHNRNLTPPEIHHLSHGDLLTQDDPEKLSPYYFATQSAEYRQTQDLLIATRKSINSIQHDIHRVPIMAAPPGDTSRLNLARHLFSEKKERLARVLANRIHHALTGAYLVSTPTDFSIDGSYPTHPGLLDHYAHTLIDSHWNIQSLCQEIILTTPVN